MVSVVIPVFKAAAFVRAALDSALAQPEVAEVLLVEDGSPDASLAVCEELAALHPRVRLLRHPGGANRGAGASRNLGLDSACAPYVAFLDADDHFLPGRFVRDVALLDSHADIDGVHGVMGSVTDASYRGGNPHAGGVTRVEHGVSPERLFEEMGPLGRRGHFHIDTLTVRRAVFARAGRFDTTLELSQDTHLFIRLAAVARLVGNGSDEPVAMRRVHAGNRIADQAKLMRLRPALFGSLFRWATAEGLNKGRRFRLWRAWLEFTFRPESGLVASRSDFCKASLRVDPWLAAQPKFWRCAA